MDPGIQEDARSDGKTFVQNNSRECSEGSNSAKAATGHLVLSQRDGALASRGIFTAEADSASPKRSNGDLHSHISEGDGTATNQHLELSHAPNPSPKV